jgi:hypothetical protein
VLPFRGFASFFIFASFISFCHICLPAIHNELDFALTFLATFLSTYVTFLSFWSNFTHSRSNSSHPQHPKRPRELPRRLRHRSLLLQRLASHPARNCPLAVRRVRARGRRERHVRVQPCRPDRVLRECGAAVRGAERRARIPGVCG